MQDLIRQNVLRHYVTIPLTLKQPAAGNWKLQRTKFEPMRVGKSDTGTPAGYSDALTEIVTSLLSKGRTDMSGAVQVVSLGFEAQGAFYTPNATTGSGDSYAVPVPSSADVIGQKEAVVNMRDKLVAAVATFGLLKYKERTESTCETLLGPLGFAPGGFGIYNASNQANISLPTAGAASDNNVASVGAVINNDSDLSDRVGFYLDLAGVPMLNDDTPSDGHLSLDLIITLPLTMCFEVVPVDITDTVRAALSVKG